MLVPVMRDMITYSMYALYLLSRVSFRIMIVGPITKHSITVMEGTYVYHTLDVMQCSDVCSMVRISN